MGVQERKEKGINLEILKLIRSDPKRKICRLCAPLKRETRAHEVNLLLFSKWFSKTVPKVEFAYRNRALLNKGVKQRLAKSLIKSLPAAICCEMSLFIFASEFYFT